MPKFCAFLFSALMSLPVCAQDTLTVMHYNLLNYGNITSYCTSSNNNITNKDAYLKTILEHVKPHLFTVNEMGASVTYAQRILANALNVNGITYYDKAAYTNNSFSDLVNMLFYDTRVLGLRSQEQVRKNAGGVDLARVIDIYRMYYKSSGLANGDTTFINVVVAHLKAGSTSADQNERAEETQALVNYLNSLPASGNYIMCGDFNVGTSSEAAYQNLTTNTDLRFRFYDPISMPGSWNNNSSFAAIHTQSTHTSTGCFSGGGMDDRFDFILASPQVMNDSFDVKYVSGSYRAIGQDGLRFNQTVSSPANSSEPAAVVNALYGMSDHLPVTLKLLVDPGSQSVSEPGLSSASVILRNPVEGELRISVTGWESASLRAELIDLSGRRAFAFPLERNGSGFSASRMVDLPSGIYILRLSGDGGFVNRKLIIK